MHRSYKKNKKRIQKNINEKLIAIAQHPNRWWDWCLPEDEKKEIDLILTE